MTSQKGDGNDNTNGVVNQCEIEKKFLLWKPKVTFFTFIFGGNETRLGYVRYLQGILPNVLFSSYPKGSKTTPDGCWVVGSVATKHVPAHTTFIDIFKNSSHERTNVTDSSARTWTPFHPPYFSLLMSWKDIV